MNLATIADAHPDDHVAIISRNRPTTYGELRAHVARGRAHLSALGIRDGDRVAIVCSSGVPFVVSYLSVLGVGAVAVPLNPTSPAAELTRQIATVQASTAVVDRTAAPSWRHVDRTALPWLKTVLAADDAELADSVAWSEVPHGPDVPVADVGPDHLAVLMFTSGTAGEPRAAMLTHGNLRANLRQIAATDVEIGPGDVFYAVIPPFHIFGLNVVLGTALWFGATLVLVQRFDPVTALESIRTRGVTILPGAPPMWVEFSHLDDVPTDSFSGVRYAYSGSARLPPATSELIEQRFGLVIAEGYGLTEASPIVTSSGPESRRGSVGVVLDGIELRIVDDDGNDALVGDAGEIYIRGENVFVGYLDDPAATARVLSPDGWLRTGDIGYCDEDGYLYLVDRAKDLIIVSGFNVFPAEVEEVLARAPGVADVAVVGVPHPHTGEAVKAYVVPIADANLDEEVLIDFALDHLARYKCPSKVLVVDELPRNATGKVVRRALA